MRTSTFDTRTISFPSAAAEVIPDSRGWSKYSTLLLPHHRNIRHTLQQTTT
jgi:hypothetical protein